MLVKTYGSAVYGVDAITITIEVNVSAGLKYFIVGLPDNAVKESLQRIESAIKNNGLYMPRTKLVVNMAPADIKKSGSAFDLPIAIGVLGATDQLPADPLQHFIMMGELSLDGRLQPVKGVLSMALQAKKDGFSGLIVPAANAREAAMVEGLVVYGVDQLQQVVQLLKGENNIAPVNHRATDEFNSLLPVNDIDFSEVKGQQNIKRALEIAAAGGHNALLIGPPGAGKTMLAKRLPGILPPFNLEEALETTKIHSVAGKLPAHAALIRQRPFRSPHHTISDVALVGGGATPQPGEISLAHNGVLFLDELPEFKRSVLEVMRQPMEERKVSISRARTALDFPASFMLIASMNPCPCGFYNHPDKECACPPGKVQQYLNKISGPLLDRIDLHVEVTPVPFHQLNSGEQAAAETSATIRERVIRARALQAERYQPYPGIHANAQVNSKLLRQFCTPDDAGAGLLKTAMSRLNLSARAYDRILKVSRTIADLAGQTEVQAGHIAEAIHYRSLDREAWGT